MGPGGVFSVDAKCERFEKLSPRSAVDQTESENPSANQRIFEHGGHVVDTKSPPTGVSYLQPAEIDPDLATPIRVWPNLPYAIKVGIIAMIKMPV